MNGRFGTVSALLAEVEENGRLEEFAQMINSRIRPLEPVAASDILVRGMYIVSDEVNSFGGRFPVDEFPTLVEKLLNTPVLVGHRKDSLPIGRTFHAVQEERQGRMWVKSLFYWLKSSEDAQTLADNIDGGIYQECSIGFIYRLPECSICGKDIRICEHQVFSSYPNGSGEAQCHFVYREIEKVLETSLVYRGANPGTGMSRELAEGGEAVGRFGGGNPETDTGGSNRLVAVPWYDGVMVNLSVRNDNLFIERRDGGPVNPTIQREASRLAVASERTLTGQLVGYRGKERCGSQALERFLAGKSSPVTRVELKLLPIQATDGSFVPASYEAAQGRLSMQPIPFRLIESGALQDCIESIGTKDGVRVWTLAEFRGGSSGARVEKKRAKEASGWSISAHDYGALVLVGTNSEKNVAYAIQAFDTVLWDSGRRFLADSVASEERYEAKQLKRLGPAEVIPVRLHGKNRALIRRANRTGVR